MVLVWVLLLIHRVVSGWVLLVHRREVAGWVVLGWAALIHRRREVAGWMVVVHRQIDCSVCIILLPTSIRRLMMCRSSVVVDLQVIW